MSREELIDRIASVLASEIECNVFEVHVAPALGIARKAVEDENDRPIAIAWMVQGALVELFTDLDEAHKYASTIGQKVTSLCDWNEIGAQDVARAPEGYALVPINATHKMIGEGARAILYEAEGKAHFNSLDMVKVAYPAMLAAAPAAPAVAPLKTHAIDCQYIVDDSPWAPCTCGFGGPNDGQPAPPEQEEDAPAQAEQQPWRCFHCDEAFTDVASAQEHFGRSQISEPACTIDAAKYREMEETVRRHCEEDTDLHRTIYAMEARHQTELRREEEKGYARGLADAQAEQQGDGGARDRRHVGDSRFEGWYADYAAKGETNTKQIARDAYAAGMGDDTPQPEEQPSARVALSDEAKQRVYDAVRQALGDAYDCTRVWHAWGVGTMSQHDFRLVAEDDERVAEIADAAILAASAGQTGEAK